MELSQLFIIGVPADGDVSTIQEFQPGGVVGNSGANAVPISAGSAGEIGVRALLAGCDILLFCHAPEKAMQARDAIDAALASGVLPKQRVEESLERVRASKAKYGIL